MFGRAKFFAVNGRSELLAGHCSVARWAELRLPSYFAEISGFAKLRPGKEKSAFAKRIAR